MHVYLRYKIWSRIASPSDHFTLGFDQLHIYGFASLLCEATHGRDFTDRQNPPCIVLERNFECYCRGFILSLQTAGIVRPFLLILQQSSRGEKCKYVFRPSLVCVPSSCPIRTQIVANQVSASASSLCLCFIMLCAPGQTIVYFLSISLSHSCAHTGKCI